MKDQIRNFVIGTGLAALLCAPLLRAQDVAAVAQIPFNFHVNQATLSAGNYTVTPSPNGVLQLRNDDTGKSILLMPPGRETVKGEPQLVFHRLGDHYFLSAIWTPGDTGYTLKKSSLERELENGEQRVTMAYIPMERR